MYAAGAPTRYHADVLCMLVIMAVHVLTVGHFSAASLFMCYAEFIVLCQLMIGHLMRAVIGVAEGSVTLNRVQVIHNPSKEMDVLNVNNLETCMY